MSSNTDDSSQSETETELFGHIRVAADVAAAYTRGPAQILYKGKHFDWRQHAIAWWKDSKEAYPSLHLFRSIRVLEELVGLRANSAAKRRPGGEKKTAGEVEEAGRS
jgi:hypothetical protein